MSKGASQTGTRRGGTRRSLDQGSNMGGGSCRGRDEDRDRRDAERTTRINGKYFVLQESTKSLKKKLKKDKKEYNYQLVNVKNVS